MLARHFVILILVGSVSGCSTTPEIASGTRSAATCIYKALKSAPAVTSVDGYVDEKGNTIIEYAFSSSDGHKGFTDLYVSGPRAGRYQYVGDWMNAENPLEKLAPAIDASCNVDEGWIDQVVITSGPRSSRRWPVDLADN